MSESTLQSEPVFSPSIKLPNNSLLDLNIKPGTTLVPTNIHDPTIMIDHTSPTSLIQEGTLKRPISKISTITDNVELIQQSGMSSTQLMGKISLPPLHREGRQLTDKKIRRLEKNRISARECRRKKREAAQNMEREINILESENLRLRLQLQVSGWMTFFGSM
jgi:hypothetical protein